MPVPGCKVSFDWRNIKGVELTRFAGDTAFVSLARCRQRSRPVAYESPPSRRFPRLVA